MTPAILRKVMSTLPLWKMEFTQIDAPKFPHLIDQLEFLADAVEDFAEGADHELPYVAVAEALFALIYAHRMVDIIPDLTNHLGYADDSSIVRAALMLNERVFAAYAGRHGHNWAKITSNP